MGMACAQTAPGAVSLLNPTAHLPTLSLCFLQRRIWRQAVPPPSWFIYNSPAPSQPPRPCFFPLPCSGVFGAKDYAAAIKGIKNSKRPATVHA